MTKNLYVGIDTLLDGLSQIVITDNDSDVIFNELTKSIGLNKAIKADEATHAKINDLKLKLKNTVDSTTIINLEKEIEKLSSYNATKKYNKACDCFRTFDFVDISKAPMLADFKQDLINIVKGKNIISYSPDFLIKHLGSDILSNAKSVKNAKKRFAIMRGIWDSNTDSYYIKNDNHRDQNNGIGTVLSQIDHRISYNTLPPRNKPLEEAKGVLKIWKYLNKDSARRDLHLKSDVTLHCETI